MRFAAIALPRDRSASVPVVSSLHRVEDDVDRILDPVFVPKLFRQMDCIFAESCVRNRLTDRSGEAVFRQAAARYGPGADPELEADLSPARLITKE